MGWAEWRRVGYSCLRPVLTGPEASATMSFSLSLWRNVHVPIHSQKAGSGKSWPWEKSHVVKMAAIRTLGSRPSAKCPHQNLAVKKWLAEITETSPL